MCTCASSSLLILLHSSLSIYLCLSRRLSREERYSPGDCRPDGVKLVEPTIGWCAPSVCCSRVINCARNRAVYAECEPPWPSDLELYPKFYNRIDITRPGKTLGTVAQHQFCIPSNWTFATFIIPRERPAPFECCTSDEKYDELHGSLNSMEFSFVDRFCFWILRTKFNSCSGTKQSLANFYRFWLCLIRRKNLYMAGGLQKNSSSCTIFV